MKQSLQLRTSQHLALTPQLQQSIRLLQLSTLELHQELEAALIENPMLERIDDPLDQAVRLLADGALNTTNLHQDAGMQTAQTPADSTATAETAAPDPDLPAADSVNPDDWGPDLRQSGSTQDDDDLRPQLEAPPPSLREFLLSQTALTVREVRDRALLELIIDALDDNGYLSESLEDLHASLPLELYVEPEELQFALNLVQTLEPAGVGARNLSECLALQIRRMPGVPLVTRRMALTIVERYLTWFAQREFNKLKKALDCDDEDLREAQGVIRQCNPHPGAAFASDVSDFVVPDVIVRQVRDEWIVTINPAVLPRARLHERLVRRARPAGPLVPQEEALCEKRPEVVWGFGRDRVDHRRPGDATAVAAQAVVALLVGGDEEDPASHGHFPSTRSRRLWMARPVT